MNSDDIYQSEEDLHFGFDRLWELEIEDIREQSELQDLLRQSIKC